MVSQQQITTEAGTSVLDDTEVIRQKFVFDRRVVLTAFTISFGSFDEKDVGDILHIQMTDGNNQVVYETQIPVDQIKANSDYTVSMGNSVSVFPAAQTVPAMRRSPQSILRTGPIPILICLR